MFCHEIALGQSQIMLSPYILESGLAHTENGLNYKQNLK